MAFGSSRNGSIRKPRVSAQRGPLQIGEGYDAGAWYVDAAADNPGTGKIKVRGTCISGDGIEVTSDE